MATMERQQAKKEKGKVKTGNIAECFGLVAGISLPVCRDIHQGKV